MRVNELIFRRNSGSRQDLAGTTYIDVVSQTLEGEERCLPADVSIGNM